MTGRGPAEFVDRQRLDTSVQFRRLPQLAPTAAPPQKDPRMRIVFAIAVLMIPVVAFATDPPTVLEACINPGNGGMRLVSAGDACHKNETRVQWNVVGPQGETGPAGPAGPPGADGASAASGPPFVWVCTPANFFSGSNTNASVFIFNGSATTTANVALHILNKDGVNLSGVAVPGATPPVVGDPVPTFPGQTGTATVPLLSANTLIVNWLTAQGNPAAGGNIPASVRIVSDQPIVAGSNIEFSGFHPITCGPLSR